MVSKGYPLLSLMLFGLVQTAQAETAKLLLQEQGSLDLGDNWYISSYEGRLQERAVEAAADDYWVVNTGYQQHWQGLDWFIEAGVGTQGNPEQPLAGYHLVSGVSYQPYSRLSVRSTMYQHLADNLDTRLELSSSYQLTPSVSLKARYDLNMSNVQGWQLGVGYRF